MDSEIENYIKTLNIDEICRTCLSESEEMISLYTEIEPTDEDEISYVFQVLTNVASIQVMQNDGLPNLICRNCIESANNAFKFKVLCERSEALLQTYLSQVEKSVKKEVQTESDITDNNSKGQIVAIDHDYISENILEVTLEDNKEKTVIEIIEHVPETKLEENVKKEASDYDTDNEYIEEILEEEFQTEEDTSNLKQLLESKDFPANISQEVDLQQVKIELYNNDDPSIQELIITPDEPLNDTEKCNNNSDETIGPEEKPKIKKKSNTRPSKKRKTHHSYNYRIDDDGVKMYKCNECNKEYKHSTSLTVHIRSHTHERPYICQICRKAFKQLTALTYHMRCHTGETPYECKLCGKRYRQSATLTAHMRVHTGQKPFLCSVCGKGFRQQPDLGYHMRTHTKEKPYMCSVCGKRMSMQCHLVQHMRTHTGEKPFSCKQCGKSFPTSTRLKRHEIIHTDVKPFSCEICNKSFNRASSLKIHLLTHSQIKPHACKICGKGFIQMYCLKSHLKTHCVFDDEKAYIKCSELLTV